MSLFAVLSDIHSNYEALKAVANDARREAERHHDGAIQFICLGDLVDYGPQPNQCMQWFEDNVSPLYTVGGNHDEYVAYSYPPKDLNTRWWPITLWTRWVIDSEYRELLGELCNQGPVKEGPKGLPNVTLMHGDLQSVNGRIDTVGDARKALKQLRTPYAFFGHTHFQGCFCENGQFEQGKWREQFMHLTYAGSDALDNHHVRTWTPMSLDKWYELPTDRKVLLNPGSVGQPRHHDVLASMTMHDTRAAYMLFDQAQKRIKFRRVSYDIDKTVRLLEELKYPKLAHGAVIDRDRSEGGLYHDPRWREMRQVEENMEKLLPELVNEKLVPTLRRGHRKRR